MIGAPLWSNDFIEVLPVAPLPGVPWPLVMERLLPEARAQRLLELLEERVALVRRLPLPWQQVASSTSTRIDAHVVHSRFVGVTLADLFAALRDSGRLLPLDVVLSIADEVLFGLGTLDEERMQHAVRITDRSMGLGVDRRWHFAPTALNAWMRDFTLSARPRMPDFEWASANALRGRPPSPASTSSTAALLVFQLIAGGHHPWTETPARNAIDFLSRATRGVPRLTLDVHPDVTPGVEDVMIRALSLVDPWPDVGDFRQALHAAWPCPPAPLDRVVNVVLGATLPVLQEELAKLKHSPWLPVTWDGMWTAARTPEDGLAVAEDMLLEAVLPPAETLPVARNLPVELRPGVVAIRELVVNVPAASLAPAAATSDSTPFIAPVDGPAELPPPPEQPLQPPPAVLPPQSFAVLAPVPARAARGFFAWLAARWPFRLWLGRR